MESSFRDPLTGATASVTKIQPYQAKKDYLCPRCHLIIPKGTAHVVVVPDDVPEFRRHWHKSCWEWQITHGK